MTWFLNLTGLKTESRREVSKNLRVDKDNFLHTLDGRKFACGTFETPSVEDLQRRNADEVNGIRSTNLPRRIRVQEVIADVASLHQVPENQNAVFQVASQFNCLEMASPAYTPEDGVGIYQNDFTQGPACSIAAGAGTIFRNYFVPLSGQIGQSSTLQIDCLQDLNSFFTSKLNILPQQLWEMKNGYCFPTKPGLLKVNHLLSTADQTTWTELAKLVRVGVQSNTQVTLNGCEHRVSQVFCSGLPIAYSRLPISMFHLFSRLILQAAYEATFLVAIEKYRQTNNKKLFLTLIGGGVFGNKIEWILDAIEHSIEKYQQHELDVKIVSYGASNPAVQNFVSRYPS